MALSTTFYDGVVTESDRARDRAGAVDYGVYGADDFKVTPHPTIAYAVVVKAGRAHGHGVTDTATDDEVVQCTAPGSGVVRWDLIVVRRNWQPLLGGPSTLVSVPVGVNPMIPTTLKKKPGIEDDQPIFLVKWVGGTSAPTQMIDLRCWAANGGVVAAHSLALGYLAKPGARVQIDGAVMVYQPLENGVWDWVKVPDMPLVIPPANPLSGSGVGLAAALASGAKRPIFLVDSVVVRTDLAGNAGVPFSKPFPGGLLGFFPTNGDSNQGKSLVVSLSGFFTHTNTSGYGSVAKGDGSLFTDKVIRINYFAIGF